MKPIYIHNAAEFRAVVQLGTTRESRVLEFKGRYGTGPDQAFELRKDILSLANTMGGVLLVGVNESTEQGYKRAEAVSDPGIETTMSWISNAIKSGVHPVPDVGYRPVGVEADGKITNVLAVNVRPFFNGLGGYNAQTAQEALLYPTRDDFGVRFLRADEVATAMTNAQTRRISIALNEIAEVNQRVFVASPVYLAGPEVDAAYFYRLRQQCGVTSGLSPGLQHPAFPREVIERPIADDVAVYLRSIDARQLSIGFNGTNEVAIPFGIIREVWKQSSNSLGLLLDCDIVVPQIDGMSVRLRSRVGA